MNENYKLMIERIKAANTVEVLSRLEKSCVRLYDAGIFNEKELSRLDVKIMEKIALIE